MARRVAGMPRTVDQPSCPACGDRGDVAYAAAQDRMYAVPGEWRVRRCRACRSLWLDPRPRDEDLALCYPAGYFTHGDETAEEPALFGSGKGLVRRLVLGGVDGYSHLLPSWPGAKVVGACLARAPSLRRRARSGAGVLIPPWRPGGRLLDVGCGAGTFLALVRACGWEVEGIETDPAAAAHARSHHGLRVWEDDPGRVATETQPFDVATLGHVVEHVPEPAAFLAHVAACLRPGGRVVVVTPNARSLGARLLGVDWYPLSTPQHLTVLSPAGLRRVVEHAGPYVVVASGTSPRLAGKVMRDRERVRRSGRFRTGPVSRRAQALASGFALVERVAASAAPVGEELWLVAERLPAEAAFG